MKSESLGLMMIVASLTAIAAILTLFFQYQRTESLEQIRVQGVSLTRLLSSMPIEQLVPGDNQQGPLDIVRTSQSNSNFAYATVTDAKGIELAGSVAAGMIAPPVEIGLKPVSWFAKRIIEDDASGRTFHEFYAPVLVKGERIAHARVGYVEPSLILVNQNLSFLAMIALPVFLLAPIFYWLIKREIVPLKSVSEQIKNMLGEQPLQAVELKVSGEMGEFVNNFNHMVRTAERRIQGLEAQADGVLTSSKVLSYQKARIESTLQSLPDAVIIFDDGGLVTFANQKLKIFLGVDSESILGLEAEDWCQHPELLALFSEYGRQGIRSVQSKQLDIALDNSPVRSVNVNAYPLFSPRDDQSVFGTMVVLHDASAEVQARDARKEFIARLAHELKTPLHIIGMYSESIRDNDVDTKEAQIEAGNIIFDEVERMTSLIQNLLRISEIEMGGVIVNRTRTRLNDLLEEVLTSISRGVSMENVDCRIAVDANLNAAYLDKDLIRVAVSNLLTNAIKYNKPNGEVILSASETADAVKISVRDSGIGISEEEISQIFERFFRVENETTRECDGHGLGLALVKEIIELHGGELEVKSTLGEGSEFTIVLKKSLNMLKEAV